MDDPGWSWPAWKFGMKRSDLFSSLHDQYNTLTLSIQDPEAFHHDVYEVANDASTSDEFHRLMASRQQQRLRELNESLESLAVEIIANPKLMATDQWQHALQLFRTKSYDSIVRYFATYLPDEYLNRHPDTHSTYSSFSETDSVDTVSTTASSVDEAVTIPILESDCGTSSLIMTDEPCHIEKHDQASNAVDAPPSPPDSEVLILESSAVDADFIRYSASVEPRSRAMSFSPTDSEPFGSDLLRPIVLRDDDETSQSDCGTTTTSVSDSAESRSSVDPVDHKDHPHVIEIPDDDEDVLTAQFPEDDFDFLNDPYDTLESDTPTPRQEPLAACYVEYQSPVSRRLPSPNRKTPSSRPRFSHRDAGSSMHDIRRSPEEAQSRIQKSIPDAFRRRTMGRRRLD